MVIVTCNGCFDGLHPGHLFFLGFCRGQGDSLVVGINSDDYIRKHKKREPNYTEDVRQKALLSLGFISDVVIFPEKTPVRFLKFVSPHIHCNGIEYGDECVEAPTCEKLGTRLVLVPRITNVWATSSLDDETKEFVNHFMMSTTDK